MPEYYDLIADLALLACTSDIQPHDTSFKKTFQEVLFTHDLALGKLNEIAEILQEKGIDVVCQWVFSVQFVDLLYQSFPYNHSHDIPWVSDLIVDFDSFLHQQSKNLLDCQENMQVAGPIQNWLPTGLDDSTYQAWLQLVACCAQRPNSIPLVAGSDRIPHSVAGFIIHNQLHELTVLHVPANWIQKLSDEHKLVLGFSRGLNEFFDQVSVFQVFADWQSLNRRINPWARTNLPLTGEIHYIPAQYWRPGQDLPQGNDCGFRPCFVDHRGRNWEWDDAEKHWDVQSNPRQRGRYFNVSPDGRVLHVHGNPVVES